MGIPAFIYQTTSSGNERRLKAKKVLCVDRLKALERNSLKAE
jgi:predicted ArsR family transcriptional regulator